MPTMTSAQFAAANTLKASLEALKVSTAGVRSDCDAMMSLMYAGTTVEAAIGGNACLRLKGVLKSILGELDTAHADISNAALAYDPVNGLSLVHGGATSGGGAR